MHLDHSIINLFISSTGAVVVLALGFFLSRWIRSVDRLNVTIERLQETLAVMHQELAIHALKIEFHTKDIETLRSTICTRDECLKRRRDDV